MDVLRHEEIDALAAKLRDTPIDVLINNAAIMGTGDPASAQTFGTLDYALFDIYMHTNALGPLKVAKSFLPHVAASNLKKIVNISSSFKQGFPAPASLREHVVSGQQKRHSMA